MAGKGDFKVLQDGLIRFYKDRKSCLPIAPLVESHDAPVVDIYVLPRMMVADKPTFGKRLEESEKIPIYKYKDLFETKDDKEKRKYPKKIFITAGGGMGKTAFARKMMLTWCQAKNPDKTMDKKFPEEDITTMKNFDFLFLLELRHLHECDIDSMIQTIVKENIYNVSNKTIEQALNDRKCLVLLDGLDQWKYQSEDLKLPNNRHTQNNVTIVTTSRPWRLISLKSKDVERHVELSNLTTRAVQQLESNVITFIMKLRIDSLNVSDNDIQQNIDEFDAKMSDSELEDVRYTPYILLQELCLWADGKELKKNKFEAYKYTIELTLQKATKENEPERKDKQVPDYIKSTVFCKKYYHSLLELGQLAFRMLCREIRNKSYKMKLEEAKSCVHNLDFYKKAGILSETKDHGCITKIETFISFQEKAFQEFFAALYMTDEWNSTSGRQTIEQECLGLRNDKELSNVLSFVENINREWREEIYHAILDRTVKLSEEIYSRRQSLISTKEDHTLGATVYDGRLIQLDEREKRIISDACSGKEQKLIGSGAFGTVHHVTKEMVNTFGMDVAVKKVTASEKSARKEMIVSRILHPFIVPMLATFKQDQSTFYFIYPFFERKDLLGVLQECTRSETARRNFKAVRRIRVCYHVASALKYLHTEVPEVRTVTLHKDVCSQNILLDANYNARLTDFGMAREQNDTTSTASVRDKYSHPDIGTGKKATEYWDYFAFGVVVREILTGLDPGGEDTYNCYLKNMTEDTVLNYVKKVQVWPEDDPESVSEKLCKMSTKCLDKEPIVKFESDVVQFLKDMLYDTGNLVMERDEIKSDEIKRPSVKCDVCMFNKAAKTTHFCKQPVERCMPCEKNSFLNPLTCFTCGSSLKREIGDDWGAVLVAGPDLDGKVEKAFIKDVEDMTRIITSKAPLIIGMREANVKQIFPENGVIVPQIKKAINYFRARKDVTTLMIYFSCHGKSAEGQRSPNNCDKIRRKPENGSGVQDESTENSQAFLFGEESMLLDEFERELKELVSVETFVIILDMCYAPVVTVDESKNVLQINSSSWNQTSKATVSASKFSRYLIQGLKGSSEKMECILEKNCSICEDEKKSRDVFLTVQNLFTNVQDHMKKEISDKDKQEPYMNVKGKKIKIAYNTEQPVLVQFGSFVDETPGETLKVELQYLTEFGQLKDHLLQKFARDKNETVTIRAVKYRRDQPEEECDTLKKVMAAWVNRYPLYVQFQPRSSRQS